MRELVRAKVGGEWQLDGAGVAVDSKMGMTFRGFMVGEVGEGGAVGDQGALHPIQHLVLHRGGSMASIARAGC